MKENEDLFVFFLSAINRWKDGWMRSVEKCTVNCIVLCQLISVIRIVKTEGREKKFLEVLVLMNSTQCLGSRSKSERTRNSLQSKPQVCIRTHARYNDQCAFFAVHVRDKTLTR